MRKILDNKKGVSTMIEYVLLIVIVMTMSGMVYLWMKTYVPKEAIQCENGVTLYITDMKCKYDSVSGKYSLNVTLKNNGRFNIRGFFIRATTDKSQELAILDLSSNLNPTLSPEHIDNEVLFSSYMAGNSLAPVQEKTKYFINLDKPIYSIEITPTRDQVIDGKNSLAVCGDAIVKEDVNCA